MTGKIMCDGRAASWAICCWGRTGVCAVFDGLAGVEIARPARKVAGCDLDPDAVSGAKDVACGPQVDLLGAELIRLSDAAQNSVDDVARRARRVDVAQTDDPVGARGVGGDVEHSADAAVTSRSSVIGSVLKTRTSGRDSTAAWS